MWDMSEQSRISRALGTLPARLAAAVAGCALAMACGQAPTSPSNPPVSPVSTAAGSTGLSAQEVNQSWQFLQAHGWNCRTPGGGPTTVCSPPGQPLPVPAFPPAVPPDDRPPTVMLKRWINGVFDANVLLIRPEIYNGQDCGSTGEPYVYAAILGYYECAHG